MCVSGLMSRLRSKVARWILPKWSPPKNFYTQLEFCQIPTLGHLYALFLGEKYDGYFVEVGANDGLYVSNSWGLAEKNWTGLMFEPVPELAKMCRANHREHPKVEVQQTAVGPEGVGSITIQIAGPLSSANVELLQEYESITWASKSLTGHVVEVKCQTLDSLLNKYHFKPDFDVLIVDVEGYESQVFSGFELEYWRPKLMIIELADTHPDLAATKKVDAELTRSIIGTGYQIVYKDLANTIFVRIDVWEHVYGLA